MRINALGNVGIGATNPTSKLHLQGSNGGYLELFMEPSADTDTVSIAFRNAANNSTRGFVLYNHSDESMRFRTNGSGEAMQIDSSGHLLVGTATKVGSPNIMTVASNSEAGIHINGSSASINYGLTFYYDGSQTGQISWNTTTTSYNTSSDYRLKEDWVPMSDSITRVKALKPVNFAWKVDGSRVDGFLAHEAQQVVPEAVTGEKDEVEAIGNVTDAEGVVAEEGVTEPTELLEGQTWTKTGDRPVMQGIDQSKLVPLLTGALQEAITKIETLETTQADLIARIEALEAN